MPSFLFFLRQKLKQKNKLTFKAVLAFSVLLTLSGGSFFDAAFAAASNTAFANRSLSGSNTKICGDARSEASPPETPLLSGGPEIKSKSAVVMDVKSGTVLYAKNPLEAHQISSLTKLVTALTALDKLSLYDSVSFSSEAAAQDFPTASNAGYKSGDASSAKDLLTAMIMCSADDCAYALAERAGGSMDGFADMMNAYAADNGMTHSKFKNSYGRHVEGHYSCAYDMALAASALMKNVPEFKQAASGASASLSASGASLRTLTIKNTHRFISGTDSYDRCYAGKTGGTAYGGDGSWSLCTFAASGSLDLVCVITGAPDNDSTYSDTKSLFDYAFEQYDAYSASSLLSAKPSEIGTLFSDGSIFGNESENSIFTDPNAVVILPKGADKTVLKSTVSFTQIHEFVYGNNVIGRIEFSYDGKLAGSADIILYTENASMTQSEFDGSFPSFLVNPDTNQGTNIYTYPDSDRVPAAKPSLADKIKAGIYSLYTPAKYFAAICALLIFLIGTLIIFLIFPVGSKQTDTLYKKDYDELAPPVYDDELSEVRSVRKPEVDDMHEIH